MDTRRDFLKKTAAIASGVSIMGLSGTSLYGSSSKDSLFKISLAEWSLNKSMRNGEVDHLDFAKIAKKNFDIDAIEYVNQLFADKTGGSTYLKEMKTIADGEGVKSLLIMCDREGALGDPDDVARTTAVENHYKWVDAAKYLGCHSIRVNARSFGTYDDQIELATDGLRRLTEFGDTLGINTIVENHGGFSSNGKWLSTVMEKVDHPRVGTLPDFGNFRLEGDKWYDRYKGMKEIMPYAKAVSAKSHEFDKHGNETGTDYFKMMEIVLNANYHGYVGIEYEGNIHSEMEGIQLTLDLLKKIRSMLDINPSE